MKTKNNKIKIKRRKNYKKNHFFPMIGSQREKLKKQTKDACYCRVQAMQAGLSQPGSTWYVLKLSSMSTIMREWAALHAVHHLRFKDVLLSAQTSTSRRTSKLMIPQVTAACACCLCLLHVLAACACCLFLLHVLAACACCM